MELPRSGAGVPGQLTFTQLPLPHGHDRARVLAVVDEPQGQGLHALLRVAQLRQLLLQRRLGEGGHPSDTGSRRPTLWGRGEESFAALAAASPPHPTLPHALATAASTSKPRRKPARWRPAGSGVTARPRKRQGGEAGPPRGAGGANPALRMGPGVPSGSGRAGWAGFAWPGALRGGKLSVLRKEWLKTST